MLKYVAPDRTKNRSDKYQDLYTELSHSNDMMAEFPEEEDGALFLSVEERETLLDLKEELKAEMWRLIRTHLTPRQKEVVELWAKGKTQIEIAKQLNVNQSSITKSINGNCDYRNGRRVYGGAYKKLRKLASMDDKIQEILAQIAEIKS